jgi:hypothetical protein
LGRWWAFAKKEEEEKKKLLTCSAKYSAGSPPTRGAGLGCRIVRGAATPASNAFSSKYSPRRVSFEGSQTTSASQAATNMTVTPRLGDISYDGCFFVLTIKREVESAVRRDNRYGTNNSSSFLHMRVFDHTSQNLTGGDKFSAMVDNRLIF